VREKQGERHNESERGQEQREVRLRERKKERKIQTNKHRG